MESSHLNAIKARFGIIGNSSALLRAISVAEQVAPTDMTVLITGESGSGKESFSKIIHSLSKRKHGQFIAVNCGAIPEGTIDSELFGHEKGSFTGAIEARKGYFEVTDGGTIFLDEIAEMPLGTQARLLRVLENGEFYRVGSSKVQKTNTRVVAATNVNLQDAISTGKFREDLYYRLCTVPIYVPPLRERGDDIELLFRKFTTDFSELHRVKPIMLTREAKDLLQKQRFPGNIRQLKNLAEQISVLEMGDRIVDDNKLQYYLEFNEPKINSSVIKGDFFTSPDGLNEREILYKILFDLKRDVTELKKILLKVIESGNTNAYDIISNNMSIFEDIKPEFSDLQKNLALPSTPSAVEVSTNPIEIHPIGNSQIEEDINFEDVSAQVQDVTLSLEKQEKEIIIRALKKNRNKRKYAAKDLGISERTLYRKIKQYDLEDIA
ncbi:sigma-54-dependent Fis family transcriptional regulator [Aquirufa nivalisilvae]|uniref:Transcriptional regulatory protein ZraR n=1 Tax=Aquirufa nivalisilvae TaxID=2516557 RepID=A0A2S2DV49_9BACT|nr:sigma-54 dependent transcriptional regulator [Aquirufa nivalisilvae]AWL09245.1 Transcriptional regulatory protein ZraR [Aquirufa nivalisilvae]MCZ2480258.1 sigma-54-dependent Fis family transcriptional regulator [Aquirufa nivalisilvae]MCZ2482347.1 sigma-54-dependent Fis family transcriptional regulator [Aquirufa nivalisilvae]TBH73736.1 sigma-54-dependent Fis family transcriptional regulator [Aquirufa nivalisilvae]